MNLNGIWLQVDIVLCEQKNTTSVAENFFAIALFLIISDNLFFCHDHHRHEAELAAAAAQPLPDDDDDLIE